MNDMEVHRLFPTVVCKFDYENKDQFKEHFLANIFNYYKNNGDCEYPRIGSGELTRHVNMHRYEKYQSFFNYISECVRKHMDTMNCKHEELDLYLVKTWLSISDNFDVPVHNHGDCHVSFAYYLHIPPDMDRELRFHYTGGVAPNDFYDGLNRWNVKENGWNDINSYSWQFQTKEGNLFVFPGKLRHDTVGGTHAGDSVFSPDDLKNESELCQRRICLSGDFIITQKSLSNKAMGLQPINNWMKFR